MIEAGVLTYFSILVLQFDLLFDSSFKIYIRNSAKSQLCKTFIRELRLAGKSVAMKAGSFLPDTLGRSRLMGTDG